MANNKTAHMRNTIKAGERVKVKGSKDVVTVARVVNEFSGNSIILDKPIRGFTHYNEKELVRVK